MNEIILNVNPVMGSINTNFDEIKKQLAEEMEQYRGIVYTEDTKADAKRQVASLRKLKKSIKDSEKNVKKQWLEPYQQFKVDVDDMVKMVDKPIDYINDQVEAFEEKRINEKQADIQRIYDEEIGDIKDFLPLFKIQDDKWINASTSLTAIRKSMFEIISSARAGKAAIEVMQSKAVPDALRKFQATLNLADSIAYINKYEAQRAEILKQEEEERKAEEERKQQVEIERARADERKRIEEEVKIKETAKAEATAEIASVDKVAAEPTTLPGSITAVYSIVGTDAELDELETVMISLGLYFERKH